MHRILALCLLTGALTSALHAAELGACSGTQQLTLTGQTLTAEIADSEPERALGLMGRESLAADHAMLFVYPRAKPLAFWMRNTLIELDIIFLDDQARVLNIITRAQPHDETPRPSAGPARYVLEVQGGLAQLWGLGQGAVLRAGPCL